MGMDCGIGKEVEIDKMKNFVKKAEGQRRGSKVQIVVGFDKELFDRIANEAYEANRSFAVQMNIYLHLGMNQKKAVPR